MKKFLIRKLPILLAVLLATFQLLYAQDNLNYKEQLLEAESNFLYEEFSEALPLYMKLKDHYPENNYLNYKIGRCYLHIPFEKQKSLAYLKKAVDNISQTVGDGNFKQNQVPLDALFYLGDSYRINNQLEKAIETYKEFKKQSDIKTYDIRLVDDQIQACKLAMVLEKNPVDVNRINVGDAINTRFSETNPVVSEDETVMLYATQLPFYQAVFFAKKVNGKWEQPVNIITDLGIDGDCIPTCLSFDGTEAYFYRSIEYLGDLYVSNYKNGKWTKVRKLNDNINTRYWESHASISHDGKTLYFTSNRPGGFGGLDIYKTQRTSGDNWGPAQNLGPVINSTYNEETPFITATGKRLYFSSFGHETMGGYDIFYSDLDASGNWMPPVNIGFPINTTDDELFFNPVREGKYAYFSAYDSDGFGRNDIIRLEIFNEENPRKYKVTGIIKLPVTGTIPKIYLAVYDKGRKDTIYSALLPGETFNFDTKAGNYEIHVSAPGYEEQVLSFAITKGSRDLNRALHLAMVPKINPEKTQAESTNLNKQLPLAATESKPNRDGNKKTENVLLADSSLTKNTKSDSIKADSMVAKAAISKEGVSNKGLWQWLRNSSWEFFAIPGSLIVLILLWLIIKKRRKSDQN